MAEKNAKAASGKAQKIKNAAAKTAGSVLVADVLSRVGSHVVSRAVKKQVLGKNVAGAIAKGAKKGGLVNGIAATALTKVATKSIPGAVIVGGGLLAKALLDRRKAKRLPRNKAESELLKQARGN